MYLSVIIPAHNEEKNIRGTVEDIFEYLRENNYDHEIIVVVNGSTDKTSQIVKSIAENIPTLKLIELESRGKGQAVKKGMLEARGDFCLFTDADNSTSIDHIEKMFPHFNKGYNIVIGSLAVDGAEMSKESEPIWRILLGKMGNLFIRIVALPGIKDTQRGFKIFSVKSAKEIFPKLTIDGWGFDIEALALARKLGYKIKEIPITWCNSRISRVKPSTYPKVLLEVLKIRWNLWLNNYK